MRRILTNQIMDAFGSLKHPVFYTHIHAIYLHISFAIQWYFSIDLILNYLIQYFKENDFII